MDVVFVNKANGPSNVWQREIEIEGEREERT